MRSRIAKLLMLALGILVLSSALMPSAARAYMLYKPNQFDPRTGQLVVVIHGCLQSAEAMAMGTGWNEIADKNNLAILYPQVKSGANGLDCWSWFLPENQLPESGELADLQKLIQEVSGALKMGVPQPNSTPLISSRIMLVGLSSGGATVAGLMACYPNEFSAAAIHSAPSYGLAQSQKDAEKVLSDGPPANRPTGLPCSPEKYSGRLIVLHGTSDTKVNPKHAAWLMADYLPQTNPADTNEYYENNRSYTVTRYNSNLVTRGHLVMVKQLGHAWSGHNLNIRHGKLLGPMTQLPFFADVGPSATNLIWSFFKDGSSLP